MIPGLATPVGTKPIAPFPHTLNEAIRKAKESGKFMVCVFRSEDGRTYCDIERHEFDEQSYRTAYNLFVQEFMKVPAPDDMVKEQPE